MSHFSWMYRLVVDTGQQMTCAPRQHYLGHRKRVMERLNILRVGMTPMRLSFNLAFNPAIHTRLAYSRKLREYCASGSRKLP